MLPTAREQNTRSSGDCLVLAPVTCTLSLVVPCEDTPGHRRPCPSPPHARWGPATLWALEQVENTKGLQVQEQLRWTRSLYGAGVSRPTPSIQAGRPTPGSGLGPALGTLRHERLPRRWACSTCPLCSPFVRSLPRAGRPGVWGLGGPGKRTIWIPQLPKGSERISFKAKGRADLLETKLSVLSAKETKRPLSSVINSRAGCTVTLQPRPPDSP